MIDNLTSYPYKGSDPLSQPFKYTYTPFIGIKYIDIWSKYRNSIISKINPDLIFIEEINYQPEINNIDTNKLILSLISSFSRNKVDINNWIWLKWLIKRFEIKKKLYSSYQTDMNKAKGIGEFQILELYSNFSRLLSLSLERYEHLPSLNSLIKCNDILCCYKDNLDSRNINILFLAIKCELNTVNKLLLNKSKKLTIDA